MIFSSDVKKGAERAPFFCLKTLDRTVLRTSYIDHVSLKGTVPFMKRLLLAAILACAVYPLTAGGYYDQGIAYYKSRSFEKARDALQKETEANPSNGMAWYFLGEVCKNISDFQAAEDAFRQAVKNPIQRKYLSLAYWNLLVIVEQKSDVAEIIKVCREFYYATGDDGAKRKVDDIINKMIWSDNQQALDLYKQGCDLRDRGNTQEAKQKFSDALAADSSFLAPRFELGQFAYAEGNHREAATQFSVIADKVPYYGGVNLILGEIYYNDKSFQKAADCFQRTVDFGFLDKETKFSSYLKLASCHFSLRAFDKAEDAADQALKIKPSDREALMLMSAVDIKLERFDDALKTLTKLQAVEPENADVIFQIGSLYYKQQNTRYIRSFDQLYALCSKGGAQVPQKYVKAMLILLKAHAAAGENQNTAEIFSSLPDSARDTEISLLAAKANMSIRRFDAAISIFEKLSLSNDDRFALCRAYAHTGNKAKAKTLLIDLIRISQSYSEKALADQALAPIAKEITADEQKARQLRDETVRKQQQEEALRRQKEEALRKQQEDALRKQQEEEALRKQQAAQNSAPSSSPSGQSPAPYDQTGNGQ